MCGGDGAGAGEGEEAKSAFAVRPWPLSKTAWRTCSSTLIPAVRNSLRNKRFTQMWAVTLQGQGNKKQNQAKGAGKRRKGDGQRTEDGGGGGGGESGAEGGEKSS